MSDPPDYIFGIGPGRCGTKSLAALLSACDGVEAVHEGAHIPWGNASAEHQKHLSGDPRAAVGYQWYWLASALLRNNRYVKMVGLVREKTGFVESALQTLDSDLVTTKSGREARRFPTFDEEPPDAWALYWTNYMAKMSSLLGRYPDAVTLLPTAALNNPQRVLDACGVPRERQTDQVFHLNRRDE